MSSTGQLRASENASRHLPQPRSLWASHGSGVGALACFALAAGGPIATAPSEAQPIPEQPACQGQDLRAAQMALAAANGAMDASIAAIDRPSSADAARLTTWFGINRSNGAARVRQTLVNSRAFSPGISFRCSVSTSAKLGDVYAYVRPDRSFAIVLGTFFFRAPDRGYDSKMGVVVHEMSHFVLAGATKDNVYGTAAARALARANTAKAQSTADNYEYFVEATAFNLN